MSITDFIIPFIVSVLMGMGVGGGGIMTVYYTVVGNIEQSTAQGFNLITYVLASAMASVVHIKNRRINKRKVAFLSFCTCAGSVIGAMLAIKINSELLKLSFSLFMIFLGMFSLLKVIRKGVHAKHKHL